MGKDDQTVQDDQSNYEKEISVLEFVDEPDAAQLDDEELEDDEDTLNSNQYFDDVSDDSVRLYLREIGQIPLLNA